METLIIFIVALALAMDCFSVAISNSAISGKVLPGTPLKLSLLFALGHLLFLRLGYWLGEILYPRFDGMQMWVTVIILGILGSKMLLDAQKRKPESKVFEVNETRVMVFLTLATSMDALIAGVALGMAEMKFILAAAAVVPSVFILTLGGMAGGKNLGLAYAKTTGVFGGVFMWLSAIILLWIMQ